MAVNAAPPGARSTNRLVAWLTVVGLLTVANYAGRAAAGPPEWAITAERASNGCK